MTTSPVRIDAPDTPGQPGPTVELLAARSADLVPVGRGGQRRAIALLVSGIRRQE